MLVMYMEANPYGIHSYSIILRVFAIIFSTVVFATNGTGDGVRVRVTAWAMRNYQPLYFVVLCK